MTKKWMRRLGWVMIISLVALNIFLLEKKDSKADRLNYITKWERIVHGDVVESLAAEGVIVSTETNAVFIDKNMEFSHFLVEQGTFVEVGTPLFEYAGGQLDKQLVLLDTEIIRLEDEVQRIEEFIEELEELQYSLPTLNTGNSFAETELESFAQDYLDQLDTVSMRELTLSLEQRSAEMELEKDRVELEIASYSEQRQVIEDGQSGLAILSPYEGIVETISHELSNPLITIASEQTAVEGRLTESQMKNVETGMRVDVTSDLFTEQITGVISKRDDLPIAAPAVDVASEYRFYAELDDHEEDLYIGYHVDTNIITDEAIDVPIVKRKSLFKNGEDAFLFVLQEGQVAKREITPGLEVGNQQEVQAGAEPGEFYVRDPYKMDDGAPFITPFKLEEFSKHSWKKTNPKKIASYILIGVLQR
ncbi:efflux RND transporter periplasmic adaptor subunit [Bacillus sp. FJAT-50079]|uniref:efflux RND transporter periplasmic adaptor subunit n=1 Tax=Bacillus sp. FJAT-50079 TaxID=2833577 RepID=UPI001BCA62CB|nr:efflux RND transporter periplasmic adaptor subunit [Bacillus sp. FJAT-50079]MBS4206764.1 efflux RND transporter periplasmic adaptor subunit [Bacillus sp. FJAT-50079]